MRFLTQILLPSPLLLVVAVYEHAQLAALLAVPACTCAVHGPCGGTGRCAGGMGANAQQHCAAGGGGRHQGRLGTVSAPCRAWAFMDAYVHARASKWKHMGRCWAVLGSSGVHEGYHAWPKVRLIELPHLSPTKGQVHRTATVVARLCHASRVCCHPLCMTIKAYKRQSAKPCACLLFQASVMQAMWLIAVRLQCSCRVSAVCMSAVCLPAVCLQCARLPGILWYHEQNHQCFLVAFSSFQLRNCILTWMPPCST